MKREAKNKRNGVRVSAMLPVDLGGEPGFAYDVSASGMFLEADASYAIGSHISLAMNLDTPWGKVIFECQGTVVRLEPHNGKVGVAVQFTESTSAPAAQAPRAKGAGKKVGV
jgi:Tfp pilus assembly protein PilZ